MSSPEVTLLLLNFLTIQFLLYPGCQRVFFLLFAAKIERRSHDLNKREKKNTPLVTIAASPNFRRKQRGKKPSGTQGISTL